MTSITKLNISLCFGESPISVGRLAIKDKKIWFEYTPDFVARGISLSPFKMPLQMGALVCEDAVFQGLFGVFDDSLPDGWGRLLLDRQMRASGVLPEKFTPLDRLAHVGKQGMGALCYEPEMISNQEIAHDLNLDHIAEESQKVLDTDSFFEDLLTLNGSSCGARPKITVGVSSTKQHIMPAISALPEGFEHWLIKFPSSQDPKEVGMIEWAYHLMAREAGLELPEAYLFEKKYFGCKRFDRQDNQHLHMHTLAGLLHVDYRVPSLDYEDLLKVVYQLTKNHQEVEKAYRLAAFNILAHNRDDHSKNFSFLMTHDGTWRLAPAYDLLFSHGPGGEQSMTVMGEGKNPSRLHLKALAKKFNIKQADIILEQVTESIQQWPQFAKIAGVPEATSKQVYHHLLKS